jgi:hypothetical protein
MNKKLEVSSQDELHTHTGANGETIIWLPSCDFMPFGECVGPPNQGPQFQWFWARRPLSFQ